MAEQQIDALFEDREVVDFLKSMRSRLAKVKGSEQKFVGLLSAIVFRDVIEHFQNEEGSSGPWAKWSPSYRAHLKEIGREGNQILQFSGRLRGNFKPEKYRATASGPLWFNDARTKSGFPYAYAHDTGGPQLPQRDFMWLSDKAAEEISKQTLQFMLDEGV